MRIATTGRKTRTRPRTVVTHLAVGRAIVLEVALATQHQLDVAHAAHAARLFAVDLTDTGLVVDSVMMRRAPLVFIDGARPLEEGLGLGVLPLLAQHVSQIVQCHCHVGMVGAQDCLVDRQGALEHGSGRIELPLVLPHSGQSAQGCGHTRVVGAK